MLHTSNSLSQVHVIQKQKCRKRQILSKSSSRIKENIEDIDYFELSKSCKPEK